MQRCVGRRAFQSVALLAGRLLRALHPVPHPFQIHLRRGCGVALGAGKHISLRHHLVRYQLIGVRIDVAVRGRVGIPHIDQSGLHGGIVVAGCKIDRRIQRDQHAGNVCQRLARLFILEGIKFAARVADAALRARCPVGAGCRIQPHRILQAVVPTEAVPERVRGLQISTPRDGRLPAAQRHMPFGDHPVAVHLRRLGCGRVRCVSGVGRDVAGLTCHTVDVTVDIRSRMARRRCLVRMTGRGAAGHLHVEVGLPEV